MIYPIQRQSLIFGATTWYYGAPAKAWYGNMPGKTVFGASGTNNALYGAGGNTLIGGGGGGDNFFYLGQGDQAIAGVGDGIDTITSYWGNVILPTGFANGVLNNPGKITGNAGNNILTVTGTGAHTLDGGIGNDVLIGSTTGSDRFVITSGAGSDVVLGFRHGADAVELDNFTAFSGVQGFGKLQQAMSQVGDNVILNLGGGKTLTFAGAIAGQFTTHDFALPMNLAGFQQTFDEEFTTFSASPDGLNTTWRTTAATLSNEAEHYASTVGAGGPFSLSNGILNIAATPVSSAVGLPYTSGEITTQRSFAQTYGYFEMRAELPAGQGMWPAFWLLPADGSWPPELDVMEMLGNDPSTIYTTTHSKAVSTTSLANLVANTSTGFHTYGVDWEPDRVTFYFDGNSISSLATPSDMNKPMYMLVNLGVGGVGSWPGAAVGESGHMLVDYVRAYASPTAVQPPLTLLNSGESIRKGDGSFSVTGTGQSGWITLGNGNHTIRLTGASGTTQGSANTIVTGNGNQSIAVVGPSSSITTGIGTSVIDAGNSYAHVVIGATSSGITAIKVAGYQDVVIATGNGNVSISGGTTGSATVTLRDGNDTVTLGGSGNTVTTGRGTSTIISGTGQATVHTGAGASTITAGGWNNLLDAGPGMNFLNGGFGSDTFVLNGAGQGLDTITGFKTNDILDLTRTLSGLPLGAHLSNIGLFVSTQVQGGGTTIITNPTGRGTSAQAIALLSGVSTSLSNLLAHGNIHVGGW
jgi:beta-glucanase (GH16 family)